MAFGDPWGFDGKTYDGKEMCQLVDAMFQQTGVVSDNDMLIEQQASPNTTVKARAGQVIIAATSSGQVGKYEVPNDASINSPAFAATGAGVSRKDRLIVRVTAGVAALEIVQGTPGSPGAEPSITGDNYEELALVTVPASTSNITSAMITDRRNHATARGATMLARGASYPYPLYSARAYRAGAHTIPGAVVGAQIIPVDTEQWDYNGNLDTSTGRYTAPAAGLYFADGQICFGYNNNDEDLELNFYVNASPRASGERADHRSGWANTSDAQSLTIAADLSLLAGDVVDMRIEHIRGSNGLQLSLASFHNYFSIRKV
jgi:hypothetical protein